MADNKFFNPTGKSYKDVAKNLIGSLGREKLISILKNMLLIRNFEMRAEAAYLQGKIGGFFHSYIGQEAIQTAAVEILGINNWYITSYRCHALALLLGATPDEIMAELYGRSTGNAKGRGGSMHLYTEKLLGGFGIVGGQLPIAIGSAFTLKYKNIKDQVAICFLGEGAVAQGTFHESCNLAALWGLPCIFVIENNSWGMGTSVDRAISVKRIAEAKAPSFGLKGYTLDGMDFFSLYTAFDFIAKEVKDNQKPVIVEVICERFRGHSISDPGLYRSKDILTKSMERDPIFLMRAVLEDAGFLTEEKFKELDKEQKDKVLASVKFAEESPWPSPLTIEDDVFAP